MSRPYAKLPPIIDYGVIPLINLIVAFLVAGLVVLAVGESPIRAAELMLNGAFGYAEGVGFTLYYATSFVFTGLAVAVAFHGGLFNIGGEGQAYCGKPAMSENSGDVVHDVSLRLPSLLLANGRRAHHATPMS